VALVAEIDRNAAAQAIDAFLRALGRDPDREPELRGTGARVTQAWADELLAGYRVDVDRLLADNVFAGTTDLVVVREIPVHTMCPHHLLGSSGTATVAFAPDKHLVGVGTVAAVVDAFARRLALQEQMGRNVVNALAAHLSPRWSACRLVLTHGCMTARGERAHGSRVESVAIDGNDAPVATIHSVLGVGK
jgi:GTP cyclohydrolase I